MIISDSKLNTKKITSGWKNFAGTVFRKHISNNDFSEDSHEVKLIKLIGTLFYKILCYDIARERTAAAAFSKLGVRQKLNKFVLLSNV